MPVAEGAKTIHFSFARSMKTGDCVIICPPETVKEVSGILQAQGFGETRHFESHGKVHLAVNIPNRPSLNTLLGVLESAGFRYDKNFVLDEFRTRVEGKSRFSPG